MMDKTQLITTHWEWFKFVPFLMTAGTEPKLGLQRILEALIIAAVAGGVSVYASTKVMTEQINSLKETTQELKGAVREIQRDLYVPKVSRNDESD